MNQQTSTSPPLRIDRWLAQEQPLFSRAQWQQKIKAGLISLNQQTVTKVSQIVQLDDLISWPPETDNSTLTCQLELIPIIEEHSDYLIINKPAGILAHPTSTSQEITVSDWFKQHFPTAQPIGDDPARTGIVHRLDRLVSGIMVVARNQKMFDHLKKQFQNHTVFKEYSAFVHGQIKPIDDTINTPIATPSEGLKVVARSDLNNTKAKTAITKYQLLTYKNKISHLKVTTLTGRRNQIRVHLYSRGHPIVGDPIYTNRRKNYYARIHLYAQKLGFVDLNDQDQEYQLPDPAWPEKM